MRAIVQSGYGGTEVYSVGEVPLPPVLDDEVRVRVRAASLHPDVWHTMTGRPYVLRMMGCGLLRPKNVVPGTDMAGVVDAVGARVTNFAVGDEVLAETVRGHQWQNGGAFAEYVVVQKSALVRKPPGLSFEEAAAAPTAGYIALQAVTQEGLVGPGHHVLVNGAGGGVGQLAVQISRSLGARVTAVDHTDKQALLRSLGADEALDYTKVDYTETSARYDAVIDIPNNFPFSKVRKVLAPGGTYVMVGHEGFTNERPVLGLVPLALGLAVRALWTTGLPGARGMKPAPNRVEKLETLLASGELRPVVAETFPLEQIRAAMTALVSGRARGRIVLTI